MPKWIKHRVNKIKDLDHLNREWGAEIDVRSDVDSSGKLHLSHDPWQKGDDLEKWLKSFKEKDIQGLLILNTKEDGLEERLFELMNKYKISNYFFLDTSFPTLVRMLKSSARKHFSCRISCYEPALAQEISQLIDWLWVDCFGGRCRNPLEVKNISSTAQLCMVSPELQGHVLEKNFHSFIQLANVCEYVCTKDPIFWEKALKA